MKTRLPTVLAAIALLYAATTKTSPSGADWPAYGGGSLDIRYSSLKQINRSNVAKLQVAWSYDTADGSGATETQPIVVDGVLFGLTPRHKVVALNAATGKLVWRFDSGMVGRGANRGVAYWASGGDRRIFAPVQSYVYAIDASTGKLDRRLRPARADRSSPGSGPRSCKTIHRFDESGDRL